MKKPKLVQASLALLLLLAASSPALARGFPASCAGTYLIEEDGGARDFWTLHRYLHRPPREEPPMKRSRPGLSQSSWK